MYAYSHDPETGGLLLADELSSFSMEPRPVWAKELVLLGFDKLWQFDPECPTPYLWAEANFYWYRGKRVAKTIGGSLYEKPAIELERDEAGNAILPEGSALEPVDLARMLEKNRIRIEALETFTIRKIYDIYRKYEKKLDCFHVAFSGGKDSIALLELVSRALPHTAFMVVFGDTGMEFPDTYNVVNEVEKRCKAENIAFYRAESRFKPEETWRLFGPPSRILRWCCTVHKSVPQTLKIREVLGKRDYTGMAFVGVRRHESEHRAKYEELIVSKKTVGQLAFNPILEWTSAEVWLYCYLRNLFFNRAYVLGNQRAGCIYCPMSVKTDYIKKTTYPEMFSRFENIALEHYSPENLANGFWRARTNGTQLKSNVSKVSEYSNESTHVITVNSPTSSIHEWLKTISPIPFPINIDESGTGFTLAYPDGKGKNYPSVVGKIRALANKAAYCIGCGECEANCRNGCLSFKNGLSIDGCLQCQGCNGIDGGCLVYQSRKFPTLKGESRMKASINCFHTHAPKPEWLRDYFASPKTFLTQNGLGPDQISNFRSFLRAAGLMDNKGVTEFTDKVLKIGHNSNDASGLILVNLATNPQINWYITNLQVGKAFLRQEVINTIIGQGQTAANARMVVSAFKRICELPLLARLHFGCTETKGRDILSLTRMKPVSPSPLVFLYGLYRFAEECGQYYEFTLSRLLDFDVESDGVSPAQIFALSREECEPILNGLARANGDFISFTTTHDLELVRLSEDKTAEDVLKLFGER